jgi:hypothetical protein
MIVFLSFFFSSLFHEKIHLKSRFRFAGGLRLPGVFGFDESFQIVEAGGPENPVLPDPGIDGTQRFRVEFVNTVATFAMFADQVGAAQQAQVFGNGWAGNREGFGDLSGGLAAAAQEIEDGAAGGVGERMEGGFGALEAGICNRSVPHNA